MNHLRHYPDETNAQIMIPPNMVHCVPTLKVDNLWQWVEYVCDVKGPGSSWIFRGQSSADWPIASSFERVLYCSIEKIDPLTQKTFPAEIIEKRLRTKERGLIDEFVRDAWHFVADGNMSTVEWLAAMRHYGVPTRMVDFTESALVALYFALEDENATGDFTVWCVRRGLLIDAYCYENQMQQISFELGLKAMQQLNHPNGTTQISTPRGHCGVYTNPIEAVRRNDQLANCILDDDIDNPMWGNVALPLVYVYPKRRNARMGAQNGLFLMQTKLRETFMEALLKTCEIHNQEEQPQISLSDVMSGRMLGESKLVRFVFSANLRREAIALLTAANISSRTLYPDLEGVARSLKGVLKT